MAETVFPAYLRAEYRDDSSGFPAFQRAAETAAQGARRAFESNLSQIQQTITSALSVPRNAGGSLDLGVPQLQAAAQASEARATAAREVAIAVRAAALAEGDYSQEARAAVAASEALAKQEATAAAAARSLATAHEQVQAQLNKTKSATDAVVLATGQGTTAFKAAGNSLGAQRVAYVQTGQQLQDIAISLYSGQRASVVFAQQIPQLAFALTYLEGSANKTANRIGQFATFLSGPWGAAIGVGVLVLGPLVASLFDAEEAAKAATVGANGLASAQSVLGDVFDLTTGKIKSQNELLILNARLTALNLRAESLKEDRSSSKILGSAGSLSVGGRFVAGYLPQSAEAKAYQRNRENLANIVNSVADKRLSTENALRLSENQGFSGLPFTREQFQQALIDKASSSGKSKIADLIDKSLDSKTLDPGLRNPGRSKRTPKGRSTSYGATEDGFSARIQNIVAPFDDAPRTIDRVTKATNDLDKVLYDIQQKKPPNMQGLIDQVNVAKKVVEEGLTKPFREYLRLAGENAAIDNLRAQGREDEANALQDILRLQQEMGPLNEDQRDAVLATVVAERQRNAVIRDQRALIQNNLDLVGDLRGNIEQTINGALKGRLNIASFGERLFDSYANLLSKSLTEQIFGSSFRELEDQILGGNKVQTASDGIATSLISTGSKVTDFGDVVANAAATISAAVNGGAANDNSAGGRIAKGLLAGNPVLNDGTDEIVVTGKRPGPKTGTSLTPTDLLSRIATKIGQDIGIKKDSAERIGKVFGKVVEGYAIGGAIGGILGGSGGAKVGGAIGAVADGLSAITKSDTGIGKALSGALGGLGKALPVIGAVASVIGVVADLFKPGPKATAVISSISSKASVTGNDANAKASVSQAAGGVQDQLSKIIESLGATAGDFKVSIGQYKDNYRVSASGSASAGDKRYPDGNRGDVIYDGKDASEAIRAAVLNAISDGAVQGIREGTKRLLQAGNDFNTQLNKALKFEGVFTRLKEATDPIGAALDKVNKEFKNLKDIFTEAGASAAEFADLEKLYGIERTKQIKAAAQEMTSAYRELLTQLTTGDNGRSLRDRLSAAKAIYDPLAADLAAGKAVDPGAYTDAARTVLDIQRQLYGSQSEFFSLQDEVVAQLQKTLAAADATINAATDSASPFAAPVVSALDQQTQALANILNGQLSAANDNLGAIMSLLANGGQASGGRVYFNNQNF